MDASVVDLWQRYQEWLYFHAGLGFYLDVSRMSFDDEFVTHMQPKFDRAFEQMADLESGAIANPDENRMVGHYWLRAPELAPTPELKENIIQTLEAIEAFVAKVHSGEIHPPGKTKFTDVLSIGIGGSALGASVCRRSVGTGSGPIEDSLYR